MAKELILLDDVKDLGKIGDVVKVADGYARNYLIPKNLAKPVSKGALRQVEARKLKLQKEHEERVAIAKAVAEKLAALSVVIPMKVGENEQLFGSVSAQMIADAINSQKQTWLNEAYQNTQSMNDKFERRVNETISAFEKAGIKTDKVSAAKYLKEQDRLAQANAQAQQRTQAQIDPN